MIFLDIRINLSTYKIGKNYHMLAPQENNIYHLSSKLKIKLKFLFKINV